MTGIQLKANSALFTEEAVLQEALFTWLLNYNSKHTRKAYLTALEQFKGFVFSRAGLSLLEVQPAQVIAWKEHLTQGGLAPATVHQKLSALSAFYTHLVEHSFRSENPVEDVKRPAVNPYGKATFLDLEEQRRLLAQVKRDTEQGVRDYALLLLFLTTAVRVGVVCNAYVRDLEWRGSEFHLNYVNKGGKPDSARITGIASALDAYLESRGASLEEPLFVATANGQARARDLHGSYTLQPLDPSTVRGLVATYAKRAGLESITPHSLRHSAAMTASTKGTIMEVSKLLRHTNLRVTTVYLDHISSQEADEITKDLASDLMNDHK